VTYQLIAILVPKIVKWGNYFKYFECDNVFQRLDHDIFQKIRAWVYRWHPTWGCDKIKQKYFPKNKSWIFRGKAHQDDWILYDFYTTAFKVKKIYYLVKLSWMLAISTLRWHKIKAQSNYKPNEKRAQ
jgi:hypothetical protein